MWPARGNAAREANAMAQGQSMTSMPTESHQCTRPVSVERKRRPTQMDADYERQRRPQQIDTDYDIQRRPQQIEPDYEPQRRQQQIEPDYERQRRPQQIEVDVCAASMPRMLPPTERANIRNRSCDTRGGQSPAPSAFGYSQSRPSPS